MKSEPNSNATVTQRNQARNKEHRCFSGWPLCPEAGVRPTQIHRASWGEAVYLLEHAVFGGLPTEWFL